MDGATAQPEVGKPKPNTGGHWRAQQATKPHTGGHRRALAHNTGTVTKLFLSRPVLPTL